MYVNATQEPWNKHYQMYTYITEELYQFVQINFPTIQDKISITGHRLFFRKLKFWHINKNYLFKLKMIIFYSMGGHGALLCTLLNPGKYKSVSAFAPACNISNSPTLIGGLKILVGEDKDVLEKWDPTVIVKNYDGPELDILIHVVCIN